VAVAATLRWHDEERSVPNGPPRHVLAAWLVADVWDAVAGATRPRYLAYLGNRPSITAELVEECAAIFPECGDRLGRHPPGCRTAAAG